MNPNIPSSAGGQQQQDWSMVWDCFDNPQTLLSSPGGGLSKGMQEMVRNAVAEMRRFYSRKVVDVLIKVTRQSLDCLRKRFATDDLTTRKQKQLDKSCFKGKNNSETLSLAKTIKIPLKPVFLLHSSLMIPNIVVKPSLEEVQEALVTAGKNITSVSKGVGQWTGGKNNQVKISFGLLVHTYFVGLIS